MLGGLIETRDQQIALIWANVKLSMVKKMREMRRLPLWMNLAQNDHEDWLQSCGSERDWRRKRNPPPNKEE